MKKHCTIVMVFCRLWRDDNQSSANISDIDVLTWGIAVP